MIINHSQTGSNRFTNSTLWRPFFRINNNLANPGLPAPLVNHSKTGVSFSGGYVGFRPGFGLPAMRVNQTQGESSLNSKSASTGNLIRRYIIVGERRLSNYWWTSVIFLGACGFLYAGISSYLGQSVIDILFSGISSLGNPQLSGGEASENAIEPFGIPFFPQGLLMSFYGSLALLLCFYWILLISWNVGGGFNEFNKKEGFIRIFRWGYPGKNRKIDFVYSLKDVEAIRVEIKQGFDPQRTIYLRIRSGGTGAGAQKKNSIIREIPLTGISQPLTLKEIEKQASELANFLQVSLEGL